MKKQNNLTEPSNQQWNISYKGKIMVFMNNGFTILYTFVANDVRIKGFEPI